MSKKPEFRVILFANGLPGINAAKYLQKQGCEFIAVPDPADNLRNDPSFSFNSFCARHKIAVLKPLSFSDKKFLRTITALKPDLLISVQCRQLLKQELIDTVNGEAFNIHFSDLPRNRGCYPGIWHLLNCDTYTGITLHRLTKGIDSGCIIDKRRRKIQLKDTSKSIFEWCTQMVTPLLSKNFANLISGKYKCIPQDPKKAIYYSRNSINFSECYIDWNQPAEKVSGFIRAFAFPPYQFAKTRCGRAEVFVEAVASLTGGKALFMPGSVISLTKSGKGIKARVQTGSGIISVKISGEVSGIKKGSRLYK
jgi:UDP-4-amino-4-deoxy-L-arabinose formyltransferase/UDP-glucuronic acid dehydrogenase (UDP-4-keto-hexauronic acid decarboxylating)